MLGFNRDIPIDPLIALAAFPNQLTDEQVSQCIEYGIREVPYWAMTEIYEHLTPEQFDQCFRKAPRSGCMYYAEILTPEQIDFCVKNEPFVVFDYLTDRISDDQVEFILKENRLWFLLRAPLRLNSRQVIKLSNYYQDILIHLLANDPSRELVTALSKVIGSLDRRLAASVMRAAKIFGDSPMKRGWFLSTMRKIVGMAA